MRNISARAAMTRWTGFFGFWLLLIGLDPVDLAAGLFAAAAATWTSLHLLPPSGGRLRYAALAQLALRFGQESIMGGMEVARRVLSVRLPLRPGFVVYPARLSPGPACNAFSTLTSMLPGTLPAGVDDHGALLYHCLDVEQSVAAQLAIDEGLLIRALGETHDDT